METPRGEQWIARSTRGSALPPGSSFLGPARAADTQPGTWTLRSGSGSRQAIRTPQTWRVEHGMNHAWLINAAY